MYWIKLIVLIWRVRLIFLKFVDFGLIFASKNKR